MGSQIVFFRKNKADYENPNLVISATENSDTAPFIANRNNRSAWVTDASSDAANSTIIVNMREVNAVSEVLLLKHNFKSFHVDYWDDDNSVWVDFSTPIDQTANTLNSNYFRTNLVFTSQLRILIRGTMVTDDQKYLYQFIATERIGQLNAWPVIKKPTLGRSLTQRKMLSGKNFVNENVGAFSTTLSVDILKDSGDMTVVEALYQNGDGFLYWPCGGDETQFSSVRQGYRMQDIFLMKCANDHSPEFYKGLYQSGFKIDINLVEVTT